MRQSAPHARRTATPASPASTPSSAPRTPAASTRSRSSRSSAADGALLYSRVPALVQGARFALRPLRFLESEWHRNGDVFSIRYPFFGHIVYFADPAAVREIFTGDSSVFHAGEGNAGPLEPIVGQNSLLTLDGDAHMRQRKLMLPPFHGERMARYGDAMRTAAERELAGWPVGRPFPLRPRMQEITLEVILRTIFGVNDADRLMRFSHLTKRLDEVSNSVLWLPAIRRDLGR